MNQLFGILGGKESSGVFVFLRRWMDWEDTTDWAVMDGFLIWHRNYHQHLTLVLASWAVQLTHQNLMTGLWVRWMHNCLLDQCGIIILFLQGKILQDAHAQLHHRPALPHSVPSKSPSLVIAATPWNSILLIDPHNAIKCIVCVSSMFVRQT